MKPGTGGGGGGGENLQLNSCRIELDRAPFTLNVKMQHLEGSSFTLYPCRALITCLQISYLMVLQILLILLTVIFMSRPEAIKCLNTQLSPKMPERKGQ